MGDRANVKIVDGASTVFLYTHWGGSELEDVVRAALKRGETRWDDGPYLARIIFCEMVKGDVDGLTGFGISSTVGDGDNHVIKVAVGSQLITVRGRPQTFSNFVKSEVSK